MEKRKTHTSQKGITLIALIITIVVLLILAAVAISSITNDGILSYAQNAAKDYNQAVANEQDMLGQYVNYLNNQTGSTTVETVSTDTDCVGYYVNLDSDKTTAEGIIYIDIANTQSGSWNGYSYTVTNVTTGLKEYSVCYEDYEGAFGTADMLEAVSGSTGTERFYVMALADVSSSYYCWYDAAYDSGISDYSEVTATGVGAGKTNTATMIAKWNEPAYGAQNDGSYSDVWSIFENGANAGWYVPSKDEWAAFGSAFAVSSDSSADGYYGNLGLRYYYWSSSLDDTDYAWYVGFDRDCMLGSHLNFYGYVRLGTTF